MKKPEIDRVCMKFCQEGNTLGTTEEYESLELFLEFQLPNEDPFFVIKTDGWSFDDVSELQELVDIAKKILEP